MDENKNNKIQQLVERIKEIFATDKNGLNNAYYAELAAYINEKDDLAALLPELKASYEDYEKKTEQSDKNSTEYTESKKMWKLRSDQLVSFVGHLMEIFSLKSYAANNTKVTVSVREILETDNDALVATQMALPEYKALERALPSYIKLSLSVDKTALKSYVKNDSTLMINHPDWVHTKESKSVTLK